MNHTATYSPDDNKLRLTPAARLDPEEYARIKAAGFIWAPKQGIFVAPMWTPNREDLLLEMCGEISDEDSTLIERAEDRAERFENYSEKRAEDAENARKAVSAIAENIPFGQPILVGHHSEKHARKDAQRIENGMRRAVNAFEQAQYWKDRAAGSIRAAKYKERPDVRARRIKGLEADKRKEEREKTQAETLLKIWRNIENTDSLRRKDGAPTTTTDRAKMLCNGYDHTSKHFTLAEYPREAPASQYEGSMSLWSALDGGIITGEQARDIAIPTHEKTIIYCNRWINHLENRLSYERAMLADVGGTTTDKTGPEKGGACKCWASPRGGWSYIVKVNKVSVTVEDNWGNGGSNFTRTIPFDKLKAIMTAAQVQEKRDTEQLIEDRAGNATGFFLRDAPLPDLPTYKTPEPTEFDAMRESLKAGIQTVTAPQLFPTPPELAVRMVKLAGIEPDQRILEPSAGTGNLLRPLIGLKVDVVAVEINRGLAERLQTEYPGEGNIRCADFLECNGDLGTFDRILMNPPFINGADIKHIEHARRFLNPGGRIVALCANGPRQREALRGIADHWEDLPEGSFKDQGTNVNAALLVIEA